MKFFKNLTVGIALMCALGAGTATAQTSSAGCVPPPPGISETPPCAAPLTTDDDETSGQTKTAPAANMAIETSLIDETSFTNLGLDLIERLLFLF